MSKALKIYRVYNPLNGKFIVEGTVAVCAHKLGITTERFRRVANDFQKGQYKRFNIYDVTDEYDEEELQRKTNADVIKAWDDIVTPLRKRFGVPVRHLEDCAK